MTGLWKCQCSCGNYTWASAYRITHNKKKSCDECSLRNKYRRKKNNQYILDGEFGIGIAYNTGTKFFFDLEDYDLIKDYSWKENNNGYIQAVKNNKYVLMHRLVCRVDDGDIHIDHKCHNKFDNRKAFLRITNCRNNTRNEVLAKNNKSGVTGVCWEKSSNKWHSYIWVDGKSIHLGRFLQKEEAIKARIAAEDIYFGEFGYHNSIKGER